MNYVNIGNIYITFSTSIFQDMLQSLARIEDLCKLQGKLEYKSRANEFIVKLSDYSGTTYF